MSVWRKANGVTASSLAGPGSHGRHLSRVFSVVSRSVRTCVGDERRRQRVLVHVDPEALRLDPTPFGAVGRTRIAHHLVEIPAAQRWKVMSLGHSIGSTRR